MTASKVIAALAIVALAIVLGVAIHPLLLILLVLLVLLVF